METEKEKLIRKIRYLFYDYIIIMYNRYIAKKVFKYCIKNAERAKLDKEISTKYSKSVCLNDYIIIFLPCRENLNKIEQIIIYKSKFLKKRHVWNNIYNKIKFIYKRNESDEEFTKMGEKLYEKYNYLWR